MRRSNELFESSDEAEGDAKATNGASQRTTLRKMQHGGVVDHDWTKNGMQTQITEDRPMEGAVVNAAGPEVF